MRQGFGHFRFTMGGGLCHIDAEMTLKAIEEQIKAVR